MHQGTTSDNGIWYTVYVIGDLGIHKGKPLAFFYSRLENEARKKCSESLKNGKCCFIKKEHFPPAIY